MKKSFLSIISLTALLALTGCSKEATGGVTEECRFAPEAIELNAMSTMLFVGEKLQLEPMVTPLIAQKAKLNYVSSNTKVVTVSSKGLVKAVGEGVADIVVSSASDETVSKAMTFYVSKSQDKSKVQSELGKMANYQEKHVEVPTKLLTYETETRWRYRDDELYYKSTGYEKIIMDKDNAYFYVGGSDATIRVQDSDPVRSTFGYHIFTDRDYHSYIYHHNDYAKNRCYIATEFYLGTETQRYEVIYAILNSLFKIGSDIAEDNFADCMSTDWLTDYASSAKSGGYGTDYVFAEFKQSGGPKEETTPTMEQNLDIPAYLPLKINLIARAYWYKGEVKSYSLYFIYAYNYEGHAYRFELKREYTFFRGDEFSYELPDRNEYQEVSDIFEL